MTDYTLVYSKRRTLAIHVLPDGTVEARAPKGMSRRRIQAFLDSKEPWIRRKQAELLAREQLRRQQQPEPGQVIRFFGRPVRLAAAGTEPSPPDGEQLLLLTGEDPDRWREEIAAAARTAAKAYIPGRVAELAAAWGFSDTGVTITGARTRWGSCSGKNRLSFSLRLAYAEPAAVDYVILHELAHTREHNHSARFWAIIAARMPDYRQRQKELRELQERLSLLGL